MNVFFDFSSYYEKATRRKKKLAKLYKKLAFFNLWPKNRQNDKTMIVKKSFALKRLNFCALTVPFNYRQF